MWTIINIQDNWDDDEEAKSAAAPGGAKSAAEAKKKKRLQDAIAEKEVCLD